MSHLNDFLYRLNDTDRRVGALERREYAGGTIVGGNVDYSGTPTAGAITYWTGAGTIAAAAFGTSQVALLGTPNTFTQNNAVNSTATSGTAFSVTRNLASGSTDSPVVSIVQDHASDDQIALRVQQDGSGAAIFVPSGGGTAFMADNLGTVWVGQGIRASSANGVSIYDDAGNYGLAIADGGQVKILPTSTTPIGLLIYDANNVVTGARFALQTQASGTTSTDGFAFVFANPNVFLTNYENGSIYFWTNNTNQMELTSAGALVVPYIWANAVNGTNVQINSNGILTKATSSRRYKRDIRALDKEYGAEFLKLLHPVLYRERRRFVDDIEIVDGKEAKKTELRDYQPGETSPDYVGLIAEDVYEAGGAPFVSLDDEGQPETLHYDRLTAPLVAGWQDHEARIAELERIVAGVQRQQGRE